MKINKLTGINMCAALFLLVLYLLVCVPAWSEVVDFKSDRWVLKDAEVIQHMDRKCLIGYAYLKDLEFENGIIEVDIFVNGDRSYPGIVFRMQSEDNYERFYVRPHSSKYSADILQYTPVFNGIAGWQLYNGEGFTANALIPTNQWIHFRMEVQGKQARVFIDDAEQPDLVINELKHGVSKGTIGVFGARDRAAIFSNFTYEMDTSLEFDPAPGVETPYGMVTEWRLSQGFKFNQIDMERNPYEQQLPGIEWREIISEPSGLVDIARYVKRIGREPDCVLAKTTIHSDSKGLKELLFGYSDLISIFINGKLVFIGNSAYRQRDPSFLGIVGLNDAVYLPLNKGENELILMIMESFGGWGFVCRDGDAVFLGENVQKRWETAKDFITPETAVYDHDRDVLYISNYDWFNVNPAGGNQFISRVSPEGKIEELKWITGLNNPTGMAIFENKLFVVERADIAEIDIESGQIMERYSVTAPMFLNDIAIDRSGNIYVSDSRKNIVNRFSDGSFEEWLKGDEISMPNGLHVHENSLIVGNNGDNSLKAFGLESKELSMSVNLGAGIIDGIETDEDGNYLVSHAEGKVYRIDPSGKITKLLDTSAPDIRTANFEFIDGRDLIVIPTLFVNKIMAYEVGR